MSAKEEIVKKSTTSAPKDKAEVEPSVASQAPEETANGRQGADTAPPVAAEEPTEPALAAQEVEELKARAAKADEHWDRLLRTTADLENFKKRATREKQEAIKFANEGLLVKLLPALDNFDMALAAADSAEGTRVDSLKTGITMVYHQQIGRASCRERV